MKIAIDVTPLKDGSQHKVRGVGSYIRSLKDSLLEYYPNNQYTFFVQGEKLPSDLDIIHYPYFEPFFVTLPFKKQPKIVVTVHDLIPIANKEHFPVGIKGGVSWQIEKFLLRRVDAVVSDSQASKDEIIKYAGIAEEKIHVIFLAAGKEFKKVESGKLKVESLKRRYRLPEKFVLYVGDATWNKNVPNFIKAIKQLKVPLVMVGKAIAEKDFDATHPWNKDLVAIQKETEDNSLFIKLGFVPIEDLVALYNLATVFVMLSFAEGFGLPLLEALSCGCPSVASNTSSLPEVAGEAAVFIDPTSVNDIANAIERVIGNKKLQEELTKKGLEQAKKFSWKKTASGTIKVYEKVLGRQ